MSDSAVEEKSMQSEEQLQTRAPATAGALLRQAREAARVQLSTMAATLKVPQHKLQALEADDYESFPDHVFMRALAMGMCRTLQVDAEPVLALLPQRALKSLGMAAPGINQAVKVRSNFKSSGSSLDSGNGSSRKIAAGVLILLAAAAAIYFAPFQQSAGDAQDGGAAQSAATVQTEQVSHSGADNSAAVALGQASSSLSNSEADVPATEPAVEPAASTTSTTANATTASTAPTAATTAPTAPATAVPAAEVASAAALVQAPTPNAGALLVLKVNVGQSWVRVKDATGKVVLEKTLSKDESATAEGQLPLSVTVGNAKGTQVTVRGEPLDISTTRDNVARFEVK